MRDPLRGQLRGGGLASTSAALVVRCPYWAGVVAPLRIRVGNHGYRQRVPTVPNNCRCLISGDLAALTGALVSPFQGNLNKHRGHSAMYSISAAAIPTKSTPPSGRFDPAVMLHGLDTMHTITRLVSRGSRHYFHASIESSKVAAFSQKMAERYDLAASPDTRKKRRRRGQRVYSMVIHHSPRSAMFDVWVFSTDGDHPLHSMEKWSDAKDKKSRITFNDYELVREPVPGRLAEKYKPGKINSVTWTWRYVRPRMDSFYAEIKHACSMRSISELKSIIYRLRGTAGFRAARGQVMVLHQLIRDECAYRGLATPDLPTIVWVGAATKNDKRRRLSLVLRSIHRASRAVDDSPANLRHY